MVSKLTVRINLITLVDRSVQTILYVVPQFVAKRAGILGFDLVQLFLQQRDSFP